MTKSSPLMSLRLALISLMAAATLPTAQAEPLPPQVLESLRNVAASYQMIQTDYVTPVEGVRVMNACMKGMFRELDEASAYLDTEALDDLMGRRKSDLVGVGIDLVQRAGLPAVVAVIEGSPAERAGLRPRDYILEIDGESMEETELANAQAKLRGKPGSEVTLAIRRPGESTSRALKLMREAAVNKPVSGRRWGADVGYLRVRGVRESTPGELRAAFSALQQAGPLNGLVLDLRRSPGGLLHSSIEIAAMFLPEQAVVVRTEGRLAEANQIYTADRAEVRKSSKSSRDAWPDALTALPLVVLVDGGTASGAEIIAAALRDNGRARLLGSRTFGRGTIQTVRMLPASTAVKLTTAVYRTPGGQLLHSRGLQPDESIPDLDLPDQAGTDKDPAMHRAGTLLASKAGRSGS